MHATTFGVSFCIGKKENSFCFQPYRGCLGWLLLSHFPFKRFNFSLVRLIQYLQSWSHRIAGRAGWHHGCESHHPYKPQWWLWMVGIMFLIMQDVLILPVRFILPAVPFTLTTLGNMMKSHRVTALQGFPLFYKHILNHGLKYLPMRHPLYLGRYQPAHLLCAWPSLSAYKCYYVLPLFIIPPSWKHSKDVKSSLEKVNVRIN